MESKSGELARKNDPKDPCNKTGIFKCLENILSNSDDNIGGKSGYVKKHSVFFFINTDVYHMRAPIPLSGILDHSSSCSAGLDTSHYNLSHLRLCPLTEK